jgi:hypothetical protein
MERAARHGVGDVMAAIRIVGHPRGLHFEDAEPDAVVDHIADQRLAGLARPLEKRVRVFGRPQRPDRAQARHRAAGIVDDGEEHDGVGSATQRLGVERTLDTMPAVVA